MGEPQSPDVEQVELRMISGNTLKVPARLDDTLSALSEAVAAQLQILPSEIRFCLGAVGFGQADWHRSLREVGVDGAGGAQTLTVVRVPRLTLQFLQGSWVNSRGAKIEVDGERANISGLVTWPVTLDDNGTVTAVGEKEVLSLSGIDTINFQQDAWFRVRPQDGWICVTLRTVAGFSRRLEDLRPHETLGALRTRAEEELETELNRSGEPLAMHLEARTLNPSEDLRTLAELGIEDGVTLICAR